MLPDAFIAHESENRLRLRVPSMRGNKDYFSFLRNGLSDYPGVRRVEVNPQTAGVLLFHDLSLDVFAEHAVVDGFFRLNASSAVGKPVHVQVVGPVKSLNEKLKRLSRGELDVASVAFIGLVGVGIYQVGRGNFAAPAWHTALWYALNTILMAQGKKGGGAGD